MAKEDFLAYIKKRRGELQMTQRDVAAEMNVDPAYVARIETGKQLGSIDNLRDLAHALKVKPGLLIDILDAEEGTLDEIQESMPLPPDITMTERYQLERYLAFLYTERNARPATGRSAAESAKDARKFLKQQKEQKQRNVENNPQMEENNPTEKRQQKVPENR